jgi:hypothetical protein
MDFGSSIVSSHEEILTSALRNIRFTRLSKKDRKQLVYNKSKLCEFHVELISDADTLFLYNIETMQLYGACSCTTRTFEHRDFPDGFNICWVNIRCTYDTLTIPELPFYLTGGRLLWASILQYCFNMFGNNFSVLNHSISEAVGYHIAMGMNPYADSPIRNYFDVPSAQHIIQQFDGNFIQEYFDTRRDELMLRPTTSYLFYVAHPEINYSNIPSIIHSLPVSTRMGGKKTKSKSKSKSNSKSNSKSKSKSKYK